MFAKIINKITDCSAAGDVCGDHCIIVHGTPGCSSSPAAGKKLHGDGEMGRWGEMVMGIVDTRYRVDKNICC